MLLLHTHLRAMGIFDSLLSPGAAGSRGAALDFLCPDLPVAFYTLQSHARTALTYRNCFPSLELHQAAWYEAPNPSYPIRTFPKSLIEGEPGTKCLFLLLTIL